MEIHIFLYKDQRICTPLYRDVSYIYSAVGISEALMISVKFFPSFACNVIYCTYYSSSLCLMLNPEQKLSVSWLTSPYINQFHAEPVFTYYLDLWNWLCNSVPLLISCSHIATTICNFLCLQYFHYISLCLCNIPSWSFSTID